MGKHRWRAFNHDVQDGLHLPENGARMLALLAGLLAMTAPSGGPPAPCNPSNLAISFDGKDGEFGGMSHSGTQMTVRSRGHAACLLAGLPTVSFRNAEGEPLPIGRKAPPGMHPGPVVLPVRLDPGATARADLRWVSADVYENGRCLKPTQVTITLVGKRTTLPFAGTICGEAGKPATFEQPPLTK